jgi:hypothetical protein
MTYLVKERIRVNVVYLVKGYLTPSDKEKQIFYNGTSPSKAFEYFERYSKKAEIVIELYEDGFLVRNFNQ